MNDIWVSSDWHLVNQDHNDTRHPFKSKEWLKRMAKNYHTMIDSSDVFIFLGDLCDPDVVSNEEWSMISDIIKGIPGHRIMCKGNHDTLDNSYYYALGFDLVCDIGQADHMIFSHKPVRVNQDEVNIHAHLHFEKDTKLGYQHINVYQALVQNGEMIDKPILLQDLFDIASQQNHDAEPDWGIYRPEQSHFTDMQSCIDLRKSGLYIADLSEYFVYGPVDESAEAEDDSDDILDEVLFPDVASTKYWEADDDTAHKEEDAATYDDSKPTRKIQDKNDVVAENALYNYSVNKLSQTSTNGFVNTTATISADKQIYGLTMLAEDILSDEIQINPENLDKEELAAVKRGTELIKYINQFIINAKDNPKSHSAAGTTLFKQIMSQNSNREIDFSELFPQGSSNFDFAKYIQSMLDMLEQAESYMLEAFQMNAEFIYLAYARDKFETQNPAATKAIIKALKEYVDGMEQEDLICTKERDGTVKLDYSIVNGGCVYIAYEVVQEMGKLIQPSRFLVRSRMYDKIIITHGIRTEGDTWDITPITINGKVYKTAEALSDLIEKNSNKKYLLLICNPKGIILNQSEFLSSQVRYSLTKTIFESAAPQKISNHDTITSARVIMRTMIKRIKRYSSIAKTFDKITFKLDTKELKCRYVELSNLGKIKFELTSATYHSLNKHGFSGRMFMPMIDWLRTLETNALEVLTAIDSQMCESIGVYELAVTTGDPYAFNQNPLIAVSDTGIDPAYTISSGLYESIEDCVADGIAFIEAYDYLDEGAIRISSIAPEDRDAPELTIPYRNAYAMLEQALNETSKPTQKIQGKNDSINKTSTDNDVVYTLTMLAEDILSDEIRLNSDLIPQEELRLVHGMDQLIDQLIKFYQDVKTSADYTGNASASFSLLYPIVVNGPTTDTFKYIKKMLPEHCANSDVAKYVQSIMDQLYEIEQLMIEAFQMNAESIYVACAKDKAACVDSEQPKEVIKALKNYIDSKEQTDIIINVDSSGTAHLDYSAFGGGDVYLAKEVVQELNDKIYPSRFLVRSRIYDIIIIAHSHPTVGPDWNMSRIVINGKKYTKVEQLLELVQQNPTAKILLLICNEKGVILNSAEFPENRVRYSMTKTIFESAAPMSIPTKEVIQSAKGILRVMMKRAKKYHKLITVYNKIQFKLDTKKLAVYQITGFLEGADIHREEITFHKANDKGLGNIAFSNMVFGYNRILTGAIDLLDLLKDKYGDNIGLYEFAVNTKDPYSFGRPNMYILSSRYINPIEYRISDTLYETVQDGLEDAIALIESWGYDSCETCDIRISSIAPEDRDTPELTVPYRNAYAMLEQALNESSKEYKNMNNIKPMDRDEKRKVAEKYGLRVVGAESPDEKQEKDKTPEQRYKERREKQLSDLKKARKIKKRKAFVRKVKSHIPGMHESTAVDEPNVSDPDSGKENSPLYGEKNDFFYNYDYPKSVNSYAERLKLEESAQKRVNDEGTAVPKTCPKCGAKIGLYLKGEPVWLCSNKECGAYYGTAPCNEAANKNVLNRIIEFNRALNGYQYGLSRHGEQIMKQNTTGEDYDMYYRVASPKQFEKQNGGICWDFATYEAHMFSTKFKNIKYKTYYVVFDIPPYYPSHTFLVFEYNNKYYYFESSFVKYQGVYEANSVSDIINFVLFNMSTYNDKPDTKKIQDAVLKNDYLLLEYDALNPDIPGSTTAEYMKLVERIGKPVINKYSSKFDVTRVELQSINESSNESADPITLNELKSLGIRDLRTFQRWLKNNVKYEEMKTLKTPRQVLESKRGCCHDQTNFEMEVLKTLGYQPRAYFVMEFHERQGGETHSYVVVEDNKKLYWLENAWERYAGLNEIDRPTFIKQAHEERAWGNIERFPEIEVVRFLAEPGDDLQTIVDKSVNNKKDISENTGAVSDEPIKETTRSIKESYHFELEGNPVLFIERDNLDESAKPVKKYPVYIVLVHSGTTVSKLIKNISHSEFSHAAISFDSSLDKMYSFARKDPKNPFVGGFRYESIGKGFYDQKEIPYAVYMVPCTETQIKRMKKRLNYFIQNESKFKFDFSGLVTNYLGIVNNPEHRWFCSRFVADILNAGAHKNKPYVAEPSLQDPDDFMRDSYAHFIVSGDNLMKYDRKLADRRTRKILREEELVQKVQHESTVLDISAISMYESAVLQYHLENLDESAIQDFIQYIKSFKLKFDSNGNIIIRRREYDQLDMHYRNSLRLIKAAEKAGDLNTVKDELCKLHYMINLITAQYLNTPTSPKSEKIKKEMADLRAVMTNVFGQHLKYVTTHDPQFNFNAYYNTTKYSQDVVVNKAAINAIGKTVATALL